MFLMYKDIKVMECDLDKNIYNVLAPDFMPFPLRGAIKKLPAKSNIDEFISVRDKNRELLTSYLAGRMLNLDRKNAKKY